MLACPHSDRIPGGRVCTHLLGLQGRDYLQRFIGKGITYDLVCQQCARGAAVAEATLAEVCPDCFRAAERDGCWEGILGTPEVRIGSRNFHFQHQTVDLPGLAGSPVLDIQPIDTLPGAWLACTSSGALIWLDTSRRSARTVAPWRRRGQGSSISTVPSSANRGRRGRLGHVAWCGFPAMASSRPLRTRTAGGVWSSTCRRDE